MIPTPCEPASIPLHLHCCHCCRHCGQRWRPQLRRPRRLLGMMRRLGCCCCCQECAKGLPRASATCVGPEGRCALRDSCGCRCGDSGGGNGTERARARDKAQCRQDVIGCALTSPNVHPHSSTLLRSPPYAVQHSPMPFEGTVTCELLWQICGHEVDLQHNTLHICHCSACTFRSFISKLLRVC